jgi:hypothetical protein
LPFYDETNGFLNSKRDLRNTILEQKNRIEAKVFLNKKIGFLSPKQNRISKFQPEKASFEKGS